MKNFTLAAATLLASAMSMSAINADNLYVVGSGCAAGWSPDDALEMTKVEDNLFTWTGELNAAGEFKFIVARDWHPSITCNFNTENQGNETVSSGGTYDLFVRPTGEDGQDNKFQVSVTGIYTLNVDLNDMIMAVTLDEEIEEPFVLYMVGSATAGGWDLDNAMKQPFTLLEDGTYEWAGELTVDTEDLASGRFRIISEHDWWRNSYTTTEAEDQNVGAGEYSVLFCENGAPEGEPAFRIIATGLYTINVDIENNKMTINERAPELFIIGNALNGGSDLWDLGWAQACVATANANEFEWEGYLYKLGYANDNPDQPRTAQFRFIRQANDWNPGYVAAYVDDEISVGGTYEILDSKDNADMKFIIKENGWYHLLINTETLTLKVTQGNENTGVETAIAETTAIALNGRTLTTEAPADVYDLMGRTVALGATEITLPAAGIYVAVVNGVAYKIAAK